MAIESSFTPVPNDFLDDLPSMSLAAGTLGSVIYRQILGYADHREKGERRLSLTTLQALTGLSRQGVLNAALELEGRHHLSRRVDDGVTLWLVNSVDQSTELTSQESRPVKSTELTRDGQQSGPPSNQRKSSKKIAKENRFANGKRAERQRVLADLEKWFSARTGLPVPKRSSERDKRAASVRWWQPLSEIFELAGSDLDAARRLVKAVVEDMRGDGLTISAPASILNVARAQVASAKIHRNGRGKSIYQPDEMGVY